MGMPGQEHQSYIFSYPEYFQQISPMNQIHDIWTTACFGTKYDVIRAQIKGIAYPDKNGQIYYLTLQS